MVKYMLEKYKFKALKKGFSEIDQLLITKKESK